MRVSSVFDAAHKLIGYKGKCAQLHGHTWEIELFVVGDQLDDIGMLLDFKLIKKPINKIVKKLDHAFLNDIKTIGNPTSENIANYIFHNLKLPRKVRLEKVRVWENTEVYAEYFEQ